MSSFPVLLWRWSVLVVPVLFLLPSGSEAPDASMPVGSPLPALSAPVAGPARPSTAHAPADSLARMTSSPAPEAGTALAVDPPLPILEGDAWRYFKGTEEPPVGWNQPGFDDSSWMVGSSGFGYGDGDDGTVLGDMQNGYLSVYTRLLFDVPDPNGVSALELTADWDDGFVAYINGQEVARRNLSGTPGTPVAHDIPASSHEAGTPEVIPVAPSVLVAGANVIAVQAHNTRLDSSDLSLIIELRSVDPPPDPPTGATPLDGTTGVSLNPELCVTVSDPGAGTLDVSFHGRPASLVPTEAFTVVALPDTQYYSATYPATYAAQTQWIVDNLGTRNIAYVTELGDCVDQGPIEGQWINADAAWVLIEDPDTTGLVDGVPYGIAVGNHDQGPNGDPGTLADPGATTAFFNQYFGVARFQGRSYYGGHYGTNNDNHYDLFSAGGMDFIAIHMEYMPSDTPLRQEVLSWADLLLKTYSDRRAIVTSHYLLNPSNATFSDQGQATWNALKENHNLFLMLCGHLDQANRRYDEFTDETGTTRVNTLVSDYQSRPGGGDGWLRILTFSPDDDRIAVETYSPTLDLFIDGHPDNTAGTAQNRFDLVYDMDGGLPFELVGTSSGPSGSEVCVPWPGRTAGTEYEWYAVVSDGASSTTGARTTFTTTATCLLPGDCDDGSDCTIDECVGGLCENAPIAGCCTVAGDCDDQDACTDDACNGGACENTYNTAPCDDGDGCTVADVCSFGLCQGVADTCDDGNDCTLDTCADGACDNQYVPVAGCCLTSDDCDDGDLCSADSCESGTCVNLPSANCCDTSSQCDDGEICTTDECNALNVSTLAFDGNGDYVTMGAAPALNASPAFTVEAWINGTGGQALNSTGTNGINNVIPLVAKGGPQTESPIELNMNYLLGLAGGVLVADFEDGINGGNHPICGSTPIGTGWHHVAATYDGSSWNLYLDGIPETLSAACSTCAACTASPGVAPVGNSIQHFGLGTSLTSSGTVAGSTPGYYGGLLDEVRIWNRALDGLEIQAGMFQEIPSAPNLIGRWGLNENGGATTVDSTASLADGSLVGNTAWNAVNVPDLGGGTCSHDPIVDCCHDNTECDDVDPCTFDQCEGASCQHTAIPGCCVVPADCDDGNACTDDFCDAGACAYVDNADPCDDGDICTSLDQCAGGVCAGVDVGDCCTTAVDCDDADACTSDICAPANAAALAFDGNGDYVTMGPAAGLNSSPAFTMETWFYWTGGGATTGTGTGGISAAIPLFSKGGPEAESPASVNMNYFLGISGSRLAADFEDAATGLNHPVCTVAGDPAITTNAWHHAAAVYDGTCWQLYLDGVPQNLDTSCSTCSGGACTVCPGATPEPGSVQPFALGTSMSSAGTPATAAGGPGYFAGLLDEVRVWSIARTESEIVSDMNSEIAAAPDLIGRWGLNEGIGASTADSTVPAENGTFVGNVSWELANLPDLGGGICLHDPIPDCCTSAEDCDDGNSCTVNACNAGACEYDPIPGCCLTAEDCEDGNSCTDDVCEAGVCTNPPNNASCDDGNGCTSGDVCAGGACQPGAPVADCCTTDADCDDGLSCTADYCPIATNVSALGFDGASSYVTMGPAPALGLSRFTIEFWMKRTGTGTNANTGNGGFLGIPLVTKGVGEAENSNVDANYFVGINDALGGVLGADFEEGAGQPSPGLNHPVFGSTILALNTWYHVAVTYDGTTWTIYLNGDEDGSGSPGVLPRSDSIQHFGLGTAINSTGVTSGRFAGELDEVRVWNVARSRAAIQADMNRQVDAAPGLVGRWGLDEAIGTLAADSTVSATHGTVNAASWILADLPDLGTANACQNQPISDPAAGCCATNADCEDGDACTDDLCTASGCSNPPIPGCQACATDLDCDDGTGCTTGWCRTANDAALALSGSTQYVTMGTASALGASTFTLEAWFYRTAAGTTTSTGTGGVTAVPLVTKGRGEADGDNRDMNYFLGIDGSGRLVADFEEGAGQASPCLNHPVTGVATVTSNAWHHAAATFDGATWNLYLDGTLDATLSVGAGRLPRSDSIQHFGVGTAMTSTGAAAGYFAGLIDEVRVWNVARGASDIQADRSRELTTATGLVGRWGFNEGTGTSADDSTASERNGTLTGGASWNTVNLPVLGDDLCVFDPLAVGTSCDDGDVCNGPEICDGAGTCDSGTPLDCDDGNSCTIDSCDPLVGCLSDNNDVGIPTACGVGECGAMGLIACVDGVPQPDTCVPGSPADEVCDGLDNDCDGAADDGFADIDGDGQADCVDPDDDGDGVLDIDDCHPSDPLASAGPLDEVTNLHWTGLPLLLAWDDQGALIDYDLASGLLSDMSPDGGVDGAICVSDDLAAVTYLDARADPAAGNGYYYIIRPQKAACSGATYGLATSGAERLPVAACP